jgi:hypothetical protein
MKRVFLVAIFSTILWASVAGFMTAAGNEALIQSEKDVFHRYVRDIALAAKFVVDGPDGDSVLEACLSGSDREAAACLKIPGVDRSSLRQLRRRRADFQIEGMPISGFRLSVTERHESHLRRLNPQSRYLSFIKSRNALRSAEANLNHRRYAESAGRAGDEANLFNGKSHPIQPRLPLLRKQCRWPGANMSTTCESSLKIPGMPLLSASWKESSTPYDVPFFGFACH